MKLSNPNDSGKSILVEDCQRISITAYVRKARAKLKEALIAAELEANNKSIELTPSKTAFGGIRYWFKCPMCSGRVGTLFVHPMTGEIGCRKCLGLEYRSRRYKGMAEDSLSR